MLDIIIPAYNQSWTTQRCLHCLAEAGLPLGRRVVVVDSCSGDDTPEVVRNYRWVEYIRLDRNAGYPYAINAGLKYLCNSPNPYVVFMNNDTYVVHGWWQKMVAAFDLDPTIGLVGPRSTNVSHNQFTLPGIQFAERGVYTCKLIGFCLMVKREVIEKLGGLDEQFFIYMFDDDDYSLRARLAGYKLWVCNEVTLQHGSSVTFKVMFWDLPSETYLMGRQKFLSKWGISWDEALSLQDLSSLDRTLIKI